MNYRHGFHAGNHTEVFKHAVLCVLVDLLKAKDKPFSVLDTHAGAGLHDLRSEMSRRTRESDEGIARVVSSRDPALATYLDVVRRVGGERPAAYPGSPEIVRNLLRPGDRLVACELHPEDAAALKSNMAADPRVSVHLRDGYEAGLALLPPRERRGLVFVDPPFEDPGEAEKLGDFLARGCAKWQTGVFAAWYPVKTDEVARTVRAAALRSGAKKLLSTRFLRHPMDGVRLAGSGMLIVNPPWRAEEWIAEACGALQAALGAGQWIVETLRDA